MAWFGRKTASGGPIGQPAFAVIDVETTGLSPASDRIIELTVVRCDIAGRPVDEWTTRFNPQGPVGATHIHGIRDADVANAPLFASLAPAIAARMSGLLPVAHNARFDLAFLRAEYARAGWTIPWLPAVCTLEESNVYLPALGRRRLSDCCDAVGVRHQDSHSSLGDARAVAELLACYLASGRRGASPYAEHLGQASALVWPTAPSRPAQAAPQLSHQQLRIRANSARPQEQLIGLLDALSLASVVPSEFPDGSLPYLELLADVLEDGVLTDAEEAALHDLAELYDLTADQVSTLHRAFLLALAHQAVDDDTVTQHERSELHLVADLLAVPRASVATFLNEARAARLIRKSENLRPLPEGWSLGEPLRVGDVVVFTGCEPDERASLEQRATGLGVKVTSSVSKRTAMLVTDGSFSGTKADAARAIGVREVHPHVFATLLDHVQPATPRNNNPATALTSRSSGADSSDAPQRVDGRPSQAVAPSPTEVRAWARANGIAVGERGRLPHDLYAAYLAHQTANPSEPPAENQIPQAAAPAASAMQTQQLGIASPQQPTAPAGWYADTQGPGERWWDGNQWTHHVRVRPGPPPGWYPRPDGAPGMRFWDGRSWTQHQTKA